MPDPSFPRLLSPSFPAEAGIHRGRCGVLFVRIRILRIVEDLQDWDDAGASLYGFLAMLGMTHVEYVHGYVTHMIVPCGTKSLVSVHIFVEKATE